MRRKNGIKFIIVVAIIGILTYIAAYGMVIPFGNYRLEIPSVKNTRTGIDISGGVRTILSPPGNVIPTATQMDTIVSIIGRRLDSKNIFDRTVVAEKSSGKVIVEIPWKAGETDFNPQKAISELGKTALLTFQEVDQSKLSASGTYLPTGKIILKGDDVKDATPQLSNSQMIVSLSLKSDAQVRFQEATTRLVGKPIAIFMDEDMISAPIVSEPISVGAQPSITFAATSINTSKQAKDLADTIKSGALPFKLESKEIESISPLLGKNALDISITSGFVALILVWLFMLLYYRLPGILADIALLGHTVIQLLVIAWLGITLTLPGIAGIILTIGMGVDANVIIFERIKEELHCGKKLKLAINTGFKKAFTAILDANMTTLISAIVLFIFGSGPIQSFAITLGLGVILSFLTAVTATRIMLTSASEIDLAKHHWLYGA